MIVSIYDCELRPNHQAYKQNLDGGKSAILGYVQRV